MNTTLFVYTTNMCFEYKQSQWILIMYELVQLFENSNKKRRSEINISNYSYKFPEDLLFLALRVA